jgi:hypothetical protein
VKFYDPERLPEKKMHKKQSLIVDVIHNRLQQASANEMKFYSRLGRLKDHARVKSMKPLLSQIPGQILVRSIAC